MAKSQKFSWGQLIFGGSVAGTLAYFLLPFSDQPSLQMGGSGAIALVFGILAGRYGDDAWHAVGSIF
jgi:hypothetical protein